MNKKLPSFLWILLLFVSDIVSKAMVLSNIYHSNIKIFKTPFLSFYISPIFNSGAALGMLSNHKTALIIIRTLAIVIICCAITLSKAKKTPWPLILIVSGAMGNLYDMIIYTKVVDFISFKIFSFNFPIFNLADSFISIGCFLLLLDLISKSIKKE